MSWKTFPSKFLTAFLSLIYPPLCLHCHQKLLEGDLLLCDRCLDLLQIITPADRCHHCFSENIHPSLHLCQECQSSPSVHEGLASVFDFVGPAASLVKKMKYHNMPYLAEGMGAYMTAQFCQLDWPIPDYIIPVPISLSHQFQRGYNQSTLLASSLSRHLNRPLLEPLKRRNGDYSQARLNREQRKSLKEEAFVLESTSDIADKTLLLVDDVMTTGSTLRCCLQALQEGHPKSLYALTFCRTTC